MPKKHASKQGVSAVNLSERLEEQSKIAREEKAKTEALLSSIGEGLIATNENGNIIEVNQVALDILQYDKKELMGSWFPSKIVAVHEDGSLVDTLDRPALRVFLTGKTVNESLFYRKKHGEIIPVQVTASPVFLRNRPIGAVEIFRDISREIEVDRLKSEFISLASHQLRTPLSSINLYTHMLEDGYAGKLNEKQSNLLKVVMSSIDRMNSLITTLLNTTRVESNSIEIESSPTDLGELVKELVAGIAQRYENKKIKIKSKISEDVSLINTDRLIVGEIFNNLLSNSLKYTPNGGEVEVSLHEENSRILFCISDTGYGIPAESQPFIFTKFFRAGNIVSYDVTGTGLGLYITKVLSDKIGADIWFESKEGRGSSFFLSLPIGGNRSEEGRFKLETTE